MTTSRTPHWPAFRRPRFSARARLAAVTGMIVTASGLIVLGAGSAVVSAQLARTLDVLAVPIPVTGSGSAVVPPDGAAVGAAPADDSAPIPSDNAGSIPSDRSPVESVPPGAGSGTTVEAVRVSAPAEIRGAANRSLLAQSGLSLAVLCLFSVVGTYILAGRLLRPVGQVSELARDIEAHDLSRRIEHRRYGQDGTELVELVNVFNAMLDRLERSFNSQRRFLASAGHELRTPLAIQRTVLEVSVRSDNPPDARDLATQLIPVLDRQQRTVDGLLAIARARGGAVEPRSVDVIALVRYEVATVADSTGGRQPFLDMQLPDHPVFGWVDLALAELIVGNLLSNAARHTPAGGQAAVSVELSDDTAAVITIENDGPALTMEAIDLLREPFRRGTEPVTSDTGEQPSTASAGAGLGLVIAHEAAEAAGVDIDLAPRKGGGLRVVITIPPAPR
ncbi:MAG: sensor histidine kinase [Nocardioides sp.]